MKVVSISDISYVRRNVHLDYTKQKEVTGMRACPACRHDRLHLSRYDSTGAA